MTQFLLILSYWLHSLSMLVFIGDFVLLALVYLPAFASSQDSSASGLLLSEFSRRSRGWLYAAIVVFAITGIYLTLVDPNYRGLGNFSNPWGALMLVKHILVVGMILIGFVYNAILRIGRGAKSGVDLPRIMTQFKQYSYLMAGLGTVILLLTAISQAQ
jgi:uncharacterized membrane protein